MVELLPFALPTILMTCGQQFEFGPSRNRRQNLKKQPLAFRNLLKLSTYLWRMIYGHNTITVKLRWNQLVEFV